MVVDNETSSFTTTFLLRNDTEFKSGGVRRKQAMENATSRRDLEGRRSSLALLNLEKFGDILDADSGGINHGKEREKEERNGGERRIHGRKMERDRSLGMESY